MELIRDPIFYFQLSIFHFLSLIFKSENERKEKKRKEKGTQNKQIILLSIFYPLISISYFLDQKKKRKKRKK